MSGNLSRTNSEVSSTFVSDCEEQPLLGYKRRPTPLPKLQLLVVCFARLSEPIAYTQIFPYINQMVEELGIAERKADVGFYSGLVDSLFAITQLLTVYHWGCLSDRIGRKPVVICGLVGVALASLCFGLSSSFWQLMLSRAITGALSGNAAVIQSVIGDITDESNQGQAFPMISVTWCIGIVIGPLLGGALSHPAERYPNVFGGYEILRNKPFLLPCVASTLVTSMGILVTTLFLEESLPRLSGGRQARERTPKFDLPRQQEEDIPEARQPSGRLLADSRIRRVLVAGFFLSFLAIAYETVFVLFSYTPVALGGLQRTPGEIGTALASIGIIGLFLTLVVFPALNDRFGASSVFAGVMSAWPAIFVAIPALGMATRWAGLDEEALPAVAIMWIGVGLVLVAGRLASMAFPAYMLLIKMVAPDADSLGSMFGLAQAVACIGEATGPAFVSSLFAWSVKTQALDGMAVWLVMLSVSSIGALASIGVDRMLRLEQL